MGALFLADRASASGVERCVVKRLLPGAGEAERLYLAREVAALDAAARAGGQGVVRALDAGADWILLEHVDGCDLGALLTARGKRGRPLPLAVVAHVARGLARGLCTLERAGLVHRDVHPGNVLLGCDGAVKLADLGVVAFTDGRGPTVAGLKGTLVYMAPEQLREGRADARSDVYAAGLVLWEALTGVAARPAGAVGLAELLAAREREPSPPSALRQEAASFDAVVRLALAPDPAARPSTVAAWAEALDAAIREAGVTPDAAALGALVGPLAERAPAAPSRTLAPQGEPAPPLPPSPRRARRTWIVVPALVAAALAGWLALERAGREAERVQARALGPLGPGGDGARPSLTSLTSPTSIAPAPSIVDAGSPEPDVVAPTDGAEAPDATRTSGAVRADASARDAAARVAASGRVRLQVRAVDGSLHLKGAGASGLAASHPGWALGDGESVVVTITGGAPTHFAVQLRATQRAGALRLALGNVADVEATCGARAGPLPMTGLAPPVTCRLVRGDGATMAFAVHGDVE